MNIIWVAAECPFPPNTGGRNVTWNRIKYLSKENRIHLCSIVDNESDTHYKDEIETVCTTVSFYKRKKLTALLKSLFYPFPAASRWSARMRVDIEELCKNEKIDCVIVDFPQMVENLPRKGVPAIVLNQHNIEYQSLSSIAQSIKNPIKKFFFTFSAWQMKRYETKIYNSQKIRLYTFVSIKEKLLFEDAFPGRETFLSPIGTECIEKKIISSSTRNVVFVGKMSYKPNIEAALWLIDKIWPKVINRIINAKLYLVGKDPDKTILAKANRKEGVFVTGTVDSIDQYYDMANLVVVPIRSGGGVNVKLLEGLGRGKLIVTTSKGLEGTDFEPGRHVLLADDEDSFADLCIEALNTPERFGPIAKQAYNKVYNEYSWSAVVNSLQKKIEDKCVVV